MTYGFYAIYHTIAKKYLCYNSFAETHWYWGKKKDCEKFGMECYRKDSIPKKLLERFPDSIIKFVSCHKDDCLLVSG